MSSKIIKIKLHRKESILVEGQVIQAGEGPLTVKITRGARFLFARHMLRAPCVQTSAQRTYFAIQYDYAGKNRDVWRDATLRHSTKYLAGDISLENRQAMEAAMDLVKNGRHIEALKTLRGTVLHPFTRVEYNIGTRAFPFSQEERRKVKVRPSGPISDGGILPNWTQGPR